MVILTQVYPKWEQHPGDGTSGLFLHTDAVSGAESLMKTWGGRVQTVYLDPPFMSGSDYKFAQRVGEAGWRGKVKNQLIHHTYTDRFKGGIESYIAFLRTVLEASSKLLTDDGSLFVHVDWRTSAQVRLLLDEVMGKTGFTNEIIWSYQSGGRSQNHFSRKHDTIFYYRKTRRGAFYPDAIGERRGRQKRNHLKRNTDEQGRVYFSIRVGGKEYRYYEDDLIYPGDVWTDIPVLQQKDPERTGYDTQKPEALLQRIIRATTLPGDAVCDLFSGSGTTPSVAAAERRIPLACDTSPFAAHLYRRRVAKHHAPFVQQITAAQRLPEDREIVMEAAQRDEQLWVELVIYDGPEAAPYAPYDLLPRRDTLVDYWAVGRLVNDTFYVHDVQMRTYQQPVLDGSMAIEPGEGQPCVHIADVLGGQYYFTLELLYD